MNERDHIDNIFAEQWAPELLEFAREAIAGGPHWRPHLRQVVKCIDLRVLPHRGPSRLRELDDQRRAAEQMRDVVLDYSEREEVG